MVEGGDPVAVALEDVGGEGEGSSPQKLSSGTPSRMCNMGQSNRCSEGKQSVTCLRDS